MKTLNVALAVLGGVAVGAALGMLLAPKSGKETRENIRDFIKSKCPAMKQSRLEALVDRIQEDLEEA